MGCASSIVKQEENHKVSSTVHQQKVYSRETRIIQDEEVDVYIDDEYDHLDSEWLNWSGNYQVLELAGEWKKDISAGGSRNDVELFATNPQYLLSIGPIEKHPSSLDFYFPNENTHDSILVSVCLEQMGEKPLSHIAYFIYKTDKEERLSAEFFLLVEPEGDTGAFVNWRQVRHEFRLTPGLYVIIPATFIPNTFREFTLSIQSIPPLTLKLLTKMNQIVK